MTRVMNNGRNDGAETVDRVPITAMIAHDHARSVINSGAASTAFFATLYFTRDPYHGLMAVNFHSFPLKDR